VAAIEESDIAKELSVRETQRMVGRLFRRLDLLDAAGWDIKHSVLQALEEQGEQYQVLLSELGVLRTDIREIATRVALARQEMQSGLQAQEVRFDDLSAQIGGMQQAITESARIEVPAGAKGELVPILIPEAFVATVRTVERQEKELAQYKSAVEEHLKHSTDKAADLIQGYQLTEAKSLLENLLEELAAVPDPEEITPDIRASIYRRIGVCHVRLGNPAAAPPFFESAHAIAGPTEILDQVTLEYHITREDYDTAAALAREMLGRKPDSIEAKNALAFIHLQRGRPEKTLEIYETVPQANEHPSSQAILALAYTQSRDLTTALKTAKRFQVLNERSPHAHRLLGDMYLTAAYARPQHQIELREEWAREILDVDSLHKAIECYQDALELYVGLGQHPSLEKLQTNLASALSNDGQTDTALDLIQKSLQQSPGPDVNAFLLKAQIEEKRGEADDAIATCIRALDDSFPDDYRLMTALGGLYLNAEEPTPAREWLDRAEKNYPGSRELVYLKTIQVKTHLIQNDQEEALACLQGIPETEQNSIVALLAFGDYHFHFHNYTEAERYYQQAVAQDSDGLGPLDKLVILYRKSNEPQKAIDHARRIARLVDTVAAYEAYVELVIEFGDAREGLLAIEQAREKGLDSSTFGRQEAMLKHKQGEFATAAALYERYLEDNRDSFATTFNLGLCHQHQGLREEALTAFNAAKKFEPDNVSVHLALAAVYRVEGHREKAYRHARRALDLALDDPDIHLFFFDVAYSCDHREEAIGVLQEIPHRFPEYEGIRVITDLGQARQMFEEAARFRATIEDLYRRGDLPMPLLAWYWNKPLPLVWQLLRQDESHRILCATGTYEEQDSGHEVASQSNGVVIDYSALTTLRHLDQLDLPLKVFDKAYVSQGVFNQIQADIEALSRLIMMNDVDHVESILDAVHKRTRFRCQEEILEDSLVLSAQQAKDIGPHTRQDILLTQKHNALYVSDNRLTFASVEQVLPGQVTTMAMLLNYLKATGKLKQADYEKARSYLAKTDYLFQGGVEEVQCFDAIVLSYVSLDVLFHLPGILDLLYDEFEAFYVSLAVLYLFEQKIGEIRFYEDVLQTIKAVESAIIQHGHYQISTATIPEELGKLPEGEHIDKSLPGTFALAEQLALPIWTDDLATRKLASMVKTSEIGTFDTRTALALALGRRIVSVDAGYDAILTLVRWGYHFVPVNASIIYWSVEQHGFQSNDDTALLLSSLDESVAKAYRDWESHADQRPESKTEFDNLEHQMTLLLRNVRVYANFLARLWHELPLETRKVRSMWTDLVFRRAFTSTGYLETFLFFIVVGCTSALLNLDEGKLDEFLVFSRSPFTLPGYDTVDRAVLLILKKLENNGDYDEQALEAATRLVNTLRLEQHIVVTSVLHRYSQSFYDAIQAKGRNKTQVA